MSTTQVRTKPNEQKSPKMGANAGRKLAEIEKEQGKRKAKAIAKNAEQIAVRRDDRIIRFEYILVAAGEATEQDFGTPQVLKQKRRYIPRKSRVKTSAPRARAPQPRQSRPRASAGKGSGSGRAAGKK